VVEEKLLNIAKDRYELELNRRGYLISIVGIYMAGLSVLFFIILTTLSSIHFSVSSLHLILYSLYIILAVFIILIVKDLFKFFLNKKYCYVPLPSKIKAYVEEVQNYFDKNYKEFFEEKGLKNNLINNRLNKNLLDSYIRCAEYNNNTNNLRANKIHYIGYHLLISVIILLISLIPYSLLNIPNNVRSSVLLDHKKGVVIMTKNEKPDKENDEQKPKKPPAEPQFPENDLVTEGAEELESKKRKPDQDKKK
jgi:hypothetical protein